MTDVKSTKTEQTKTAKSKASGKKEAPAAEAPAAAAEAEKENVPVVVNGNAEKPDSPPKEDEQDPYYVSDSEDDEGPPPMIQIEARSTDLGTLKQAILSPKEEEVEHKEAADLVVFGAENLSHIKGAFETGMPQPKDEEDEGAEQPKKEREKLTNIDKEKYSKFKNKFEHIEDSNEPKKKKEQLDIQGVGVETLNMAKERFEKPHDDLTSLNREKIEVQRSDGDKQRVEQAFRQAPEEEPRNCAICAKMVYPVEKLLAEKRVYHKQCFKCSKCGKQLSGTNYNSHEGILYCKVHMMELFHPETALNLNPNEVEEDERVADDEDADYAKVSKPKSLDPSVVRSAVKSAHDDLDSLQTAKVLQSAKSQWETSVEQAHKADRTSEVDPKMFEAGKVKSRLSKFSDAGAEQLEPEEDEDEMDEEGKDPNIVRNTKKTKKEKINVEVGSIKSRWEKGEVETAEGEKIDRAEELSGLKGISVKERFKEKTGDEPEPDSPRKSVHQEIDTSFSSSARERFLKGEAFQDESPEKPEKDEIQFKELGSFKERFEKGEVDNGEMDDAEKEAKDDPAEQKRKKIEAEFNSFRKIRRKQELIEQREQQKAGLPTDEGVPAEDTNDVRQSADLGSIKERFEAGTAFQSEVEPRKQEEMEMKMAGKAREKFRQIDAESPKEPVIPAPQRHGDTKWAGDPNKPVPEPINRRQLRDDDDDEDSFEVSSILNKFKNIEKGPDQEDLRKPKPQRQITPPPEGYKAEIESAAGERDPNVVSGSLDEQTGPIVRPDAKNLRAKFENVSETKEDPEEKLKRLEEEFRKYKEEKATMPTEEAESLEENQPKATEEDLKIAAEHATKMKEKWEKIQRKEAKKAQKGAMSRAPHTIFARTPRPMFCFVCDKKVYLAELVEWDGRLFHKMCFRCKTCNMSLRFENCMAGPNAIYCKNHYKELYNVSRNLYDGRSSREVTPVA